MTNQFAVRARSRIDVSLSTPPHLPPLLFYLLKGSEFSQDVPRSRMNPDGTRQRTLILLTPSEIYRRYCETLPFQL